MSYFQNLLYPVKDISAALSFLFGNPIVFEGFACFGHGYV